MFHKNELVIIVPTSAGTLISFTTETLCEMEMCTIQVMRVAHSEQIYFFISLKAHSLNLENVHYAVAKKSSTIC